jgi:hypothetical protein
MMHLAPPGCKLESLDEIKVHDDKQPMEVERAWRSLGGAFDLRPMHSRLDDRFHDQVLRKTGPNTAPIL